MEFEDIWNKKLLKRVTDKKNHINIFFFNWLSNSILNIDFKKKDQTPLLPTISKRLIITPGIV